MVDINDAILALPSPEIAIYKGPLQNILIKTTNKGIQIRCELKNPTNYDIYEEANGRLVTIFLKGPFKDVPQKKGVFTFDFRDANVSDVLMALAKSAGVNVVIDDSVTGTISVAFDDLTFEQALGYILKVRGLEQYKMENNIIIADKGTLEKNFDMLKTQRFQLKYVNFDTAIRALSMFITEPNRISEDLATRSLLVRGREEELIKVEDVLKTIDVALETRIFPLSNNLYDDIAQLTRIVQLIKIIIPDEKRISLNYNLNENREIKEKMDEEVKVQVKVPLGNPYFVIQGTKEELKAVTNLIANIDRKLPQIMIEAKIVEINRNKTKDLGVSWLVGGQEGSISFGEMSLGGTMERQGQDLVSIKIQALEKSNLGRLVGNPRVLTISGKTAVISVGDKVPYRNIVTDIDGNKTYPLQWLDVGVKMVVTPELTQDGFIILHVYPSVSTFEPYEYYVEGKLFSDPKKSEKSADTTARLRDGETLVIGGLIRSSVLESVTKIPILGDIPIIGQLFTLRNKTHQETELIIFVTPHVVAY